MAFHSLTLLLFMAMAFLNLIHYTNPAAIASRTLEMPSSNGISPILLSFCLVLLLVASFLFIFRRRRATPIPLPPGPISWPIVGSLPQFLTNKHTFRWIHKMMEEMNAEIICIRLMNAHFITVSTPEIAVEFLKNQDVVFSSRPDVLSADITSRGYLTTALSPMGEQWKKMRRALASDVLSTARHRWLQGKRTEEADHLVRFGYNQSMDSIDYWGVVNLSVATRHFCGNVMRKMVFEKRFFGNGRADGGPGVEEEEHVDALFKILAYLFSFCLSYFLPFLRGRLDLDGHEKIIRTATETVAKYQDPEIDERIRQWTEAGYQN